MAGAPARPVVAYSHCTTGVQVWGLGRHGAKAGHPCLIIVCCHLGGLHLATALPLGAARGLGVASRTLPALLGQQAIRGPLAEPHEVWIWQHCKINSHSPTMGASGSPQPPKPDLMGGRSGPIAPMGNLCTDHQPTVARRWQKSAFWPNLPCQGLKLATWLPPMAANGTGRQQGSSNSTGGF